MIKWVKADAFFYSVADAIEHIYLFCNLNHILN